VANAAKDEHPRTKLIELMGEMREHLDKGETEITTNLNTVETWLASMEWRPKLAAAPAPEPAPAH
jgi:hypothetical protein